ncbi:metallophosphoesterase family protein [Pseudomonas sp. PGPR40]|uniref:metallophosphoesterase family protein n=1 Tax=Pseudomonas sp. PGPR40 TaxID=2913476 RepID=UPI001EDB04FE|nr:metallophosphoesterase [Pseudomonas sp. PGPR40]
MRLYKEIKKLLGVALLWAFFSICAAASTGGPSHMIFASDPQFPWTESSDYSWEESSSDRDKRSRGLIETQYSDIANFRRNFSQDPGRIPVMINGDMTAFGHGGERSTIKSILDKQLGGLYDYGLGNHDYANNVDDCFLNNCAAGSVNDLKSRYWGKVNSMDLAARASGLGTTYYGSLAYSKTFGDVHMVQLHKEPTYTVTFTSGIVKTTTYEITDALDWLDKDLARARADGKIIILNMHKVYDWRKASAAQIKRFREMINTYKVTAVFGGHDHWGVGWYGRGEELFGDVPVFLSGSSSQQTYLIASFTEDRQALEVSVVKGNNWPSRQVAGEAQVRK